MFSMHRVSFVLHTWMEIREGIFLIDAHRPLSCFILKLETGHIIVLAEHNEFSSTCTKLVIR